MNFKKAVCHLWGHDFVMDSRTHFQLDDDNMSLCTRCGKMKFMSFAQNRTLVDESASKVIFQNYNYMNSRQEIKSENRTLN